MVATTAQHINARGDVDLQARLIAMAEMMRIPNPSVWVQSHMASLVTQKVDGTQTVTDVYAYAAEVRENYIRDTPPPPGQNLGAVTDSHIRTAIEAVQAEEAPPA